MTSRQNAGESRPHRKPGWIIGLAGLLIGLFAILAPFLPGDAAFLVLGLLILAYGLLQNFAGFAVRDSAASESWFTRGGMLILTGFFLVLMPRMTFSGLAFILGFSWMASGVSGIVSGFRQRLQPNGIWDALDGGISVLLGVLIAIQWPVSGIVSIGVFVGLRCLSGGWSALFSTQSETDVVTVPGDVSGLHPDRRLGLPPHPYVGQLLDQLKSEEVIRSRNDRVWCGLFLLTFFVIHSARMEAQWNLVSLMSPAGAVAGDVFLAVLFAYGLVAPLSTAWRTATRIPERRVWNWYLQGTDNQQLPGIGRTVAHAWLVHRTRAAIRRDQAQGSPTAAIGWGLRTGLPAAAILMALTPLWGISWFFNPETWMAGAWEVWAEQRTDAWRIGMVESVKQELAADANDPDFFRVMPDGLNSGEDFSFIVIGDTGEGDPSQHVLRDQLLTVGQKPEVRFLIVSSDVIYPAGAMTHYESKFYLPFKGFRKPIYAVPGNHDWYDALESFTANFLEPQAARAALRGRRAVDLNLTTTTEARIEELVLSADWLRKEYSIEAAHQRAPYFEFHTDEFALFVVDTGIQRNVDDDQYAWLENALQRAGGRFRMALLGHPMYAAGRYQGTDEPDFDRLHTLLLQHNVQIVMGGDTHDFEFYREPRNDGSPAAFCYHFVNGGGGAYLSIGTALSWPAQPPVVECGCYPRADRLIEALNARMPWWKKPLWWWVRKFGAWPSNVETLSAAFDYDQAPWFQSFMEVRVEPSGNRVRLWLYGVNGRLKWSDLYVQQNRIPDGRTADELVEFTFPLRTLE